MYIQQLQTNMSTNDELSSSMKQETSESDATPDNHVTHTLSSLHDEPTVTQTGVESDEVGECTAADTVQVNFVSDVKESTTALHEYTDWHSLPIDIKYSECKLSVAFLQQEAERLRQLSHDTSHYVVST